MPSEDVLKSTRNFRGRIEDVATVTTECENGTTLIIIDDLPLFLLVFTFQTQADEGVDMIVNVGLLALGEPIELVLELTIDLDDTTSQLTHDSGHDANVSSRPFGEFFGESLKAFAFHFCSVVHVNEIAVQSFLNVLSDAGIFD